MEPGELAAVLHAQGVEPYHARQIYRWVYRKGTVDFHQMTDLSQPLRLQLAGSLHVSTPRVADRAVSSDGTVKFLLELADGRHIESVFIPDVPAEARDRGRPAAGQPARARRERATLCISTQVGCAMTCRFCLTGRMGLARNLTAGEIAGQVRLLAGELGLRDKAFNIVLMGMGEPLHNYDATMKALRMLADRDGLAVSPRRITLSTIGVVPALDRLAAEPLMPNLAVSLHATTEEQRDRLVPVNRKYGLGGDPRRLPPVSAQTPQSDHLRVRAPGRRERHGRRRTAARPAAGRHPVQGEPDPAQRGAGHSLHAAAGWRRRSVRGGARRPSPDRIGSQEPRARHPRGLRPADRRGVAEVSCPAAGHTALRAVSQRDRARVLSPASPVRPRLDKHSSRETSLRGGRVCQAPPAPLRNR